MEPKEMETAILKMAQYIATAEARENNVPGQFAQHVNIVLRDILGHELGSKMAFPTN